MATTFFAYWFAALLLTQTGLAFAAGMILAVALLTWSAICTQQK